MRLALVASGAYFSEYGGGQIYVRQIAHALSKHGIDVHVIAVERQSQDARHRSDSVDDGNVRVWRIGLQPDASQSQSLALSSELQERIGGAIDAIAPDIVHAHGWKAATARATETSRVPCFVTAHHGGIVCPNGMLMNLQDRLCDVPTSQSTCIRCATHFVPGGRFWNLVFSALPVSKRLSLAERCQSMPSIPYVTPALNVPIGIANKMEEIAAISLPHCRVIAPSRAIERGLLRNGVSRSQVFFLPHGSTLLSDGQEYRSGQEAKLRFGYVGRIDRVKGLHILIDALKIMPNPETFELHVFGAAATRGEQRYLEFLRRHSEKLPVVWRGKVAHEHILKAYAEIDVLVFPSICTEAFGLSVAEAVLAGKTVVTSRCGGPEDIVRDGVDGFIVDANDSPALANRLRQLVADRSLLVSNKHAAPHILSVEAHANALLEHYRQARNTLNRNCQP